MFLILIGRGLQGQPPCLTNLHHYAFVYNSSNNSISIYQDDREVATADTPSDLTYNFTKEREFDISLEHNELFCIHEIIFQRRFLILKIISYQCSEYVVKVVRYRSVSRMFYLANVFELVKNCFNDCSFS